MFSFVILIVWFLSSVLSSLIKDVKNNNYNCCWKWVIKIIVLLVAVYLKSINLQFIFFEKYFKKYLCNAWDKVTEDDMQEFNFKGDYTPLYQAIKTEVMEVLQNNKLTFTDNRCYGYLIDAVYDIMRTK